MATAAADPPAAVTGLALGPTSKDIAPGAMENFVLGLNARPGFATALAPGVAGGPPPATGTQLVAVAFGARRDWLALRWEGGVLLTAAQRPANTRNRNLRFDWIGPGPFQICPNAAKELAADFARACAAPPAAGPLVSITLVPWRGPAQAAVDLDHPDTANEQLVDQVSGMDRDTLAAITPLLQCALAQAGARPTQARADLRLELGVAAAGPQTFSFHAVWGGVGGRREFTRTQVQQDQMYELLRAWCRQMLVWRETVSDVARLGLEPTIPLAAAGGTLFLLQGTTMEARTVIGGKTRWDMVPAPRAEPAWVVRQAADQPPVLYQMLAGLAVAAPATGKLTPVAGVAPAPSEAFDHVGEQAVVANGVKLSLWRAGQPGWSKDCERPIVAGPALVADRVLVGLATGELLALAAADGAEQWRQQYGAPLAGRLVVIGDSLLAGTSDGRLLGLAPADGKVQWAHAAGDVLLAPPCLVDGALLVAAKNNQVWLLNPRDGKPQAQFRHATWLVAVHVLPNGGPVALVDLRGTVHFLGRRDLAPLRQVALGCGWPTASVAALLPPKWGDSTEFDEKVATLVVGDRDGVIYFVPAPPR